MTDLLTPEERELVEELRPIEIERTRKFLAILDRLAPKPKAPDSLALWAVYTQDNVKIFTTDDEATARLIASRRGAKVVEMVEVKSKPIVKWIVLKANGEEGPYVYSNEDTAKCYAANIGGRAIKLVEAP